MALDPTTMTQAAADAPAPNVAMPETPAPLLAATDGREGVTALLKPRHRAWLEARAAAHGESVEVHAAGLLAGLWQTDPWRLGQVPGLTRPGAVGPAR